MLKLDKICVNFRRERQDKIFGHTKNSGLFDVSVEVKKGTCLGISWRIRKWKIYYGTCFVRPSQTGLLVRYY